MWVAGFDIVVGNQKVLRGSMFKGPPATEAIGFGLSSKISLKRVPNPPAKMKAFTRNLYSKNS